MKVDNGYVQAPVPEGIDLKEEILRLKKRRTLSSSPITTRWVKSRRWLIL